MSKKLGAILVAAAVWGICLPESGAANRRRRYYSTRQAPGGIVGPGARHFSPSLRAASNSTNYRALLHLGFSPSQASSMLYPRRNSELSRGQQVEVQNWSGGGRNTGTVLRSGGGRAVVEVPTLGAPGGTEVYSGRVSSRWSTGAPVVVRDMTAHELYELHGWSTR